MKILNTTLQDLARHFDADFLEHSIECNSENSLLYHLTYGETEIDVEPLLPYIKKKSTVAELFAGAGVESYELSAQRPEAKFYCLDLVKPFKQLKAKNVVHLEQDVLCSFTKQIEKADLIFIGGANASLACMSTLPQIEKLFKNVHNNLSKKGVFACSSYAPEYTYSTWVTHYETYQVQFYKEFIGFTVKIFHLHYYDDTTGCMNIFHLLNLYDKKGVKQLSIHNTEPYKSYPYSQKVVLDIADGCGFKFEKNIGQYNIFKKQ